MSGKYSYFQIIRKNSHLIIHFREISYVKGTLPKNNIKYSIEFSKQNGTREKMGPWTWERKP